MMDARELDTEELAAALRDATAGVQPRPGLAEDVVRGGRRRQVRRRISVVSTAIVAAVAVAATTLLGWQAQSERLDQATDPRLTEPTRGDLAGDAQFLAAVTRTWNDQIWTTYTGPGRAAADPAVSAPHVFWAGTTPAGKVAVVLQAIPGVQQPVTISGLVAPSPHVQHAGPPLALLAVASAVPGEQSSGFAYRLGVKGRTVLANFADRPLWLSGEVAYDAAGKATRAWQPMRMRDGVGLAELTGSLGSMDARVLTTDPAGGVRPGNVLTARYADPTAVAAAAAGFLPGLKWARPDGRAHMMTVGPPSDHGTDPDWTARHFLDGLRASGLLDEAGPTATGDSPWYVTLGGSGTTIVSEYAPLHSGPARLYAVRLDENGEFVRALPSGPISATADLPVLAGLGGDGWIAAAKGSSLSYRFGSDGGWQTPATDVLRVPEGATQVRVQRPGRQPAIVDIK